MTEAQFDREARAAFARLFRSEDPFDRPIAVRVPHRALLYPVMMQPDQEKLGAIVDALQHTGEAGFFVSALGRQPALENDLTYHYYIPRDACERYLSLPWIGVLETAVYSIDGEWGMMVSSEQHCVASAHDARAFADLVGVGSGQVPDQVTNFLAFWHENRERFGSDTSWIPGLLENVFGDSTAQEMLIAARY